MSNAKKKNTVKSEKVQYDAPMQFKVTQSVRERIMEKARTRETKIGEMIRTIVMQWLAEDDARLAGE